MGIDKIMKVRDSEAFKMRQVYADHFVSFQELKGEHEGNTYLLLLLSKISEKEGVDLSQFRNVDIPNGAEQAVGRSLVRALTLKGLNVNLLHSDL